MFYKKNPYFSLFSNPLGAGILFLMGGNILGTKLSSKFKNYSINSLTIIGSSTYTYNTQTIYYRISSKAINSPVFVNARM